MKKNDSIDRAFRKWLGEYNEALKKISERKKEFKTSSDIPLSALSSPLDFHDAFYVEKLGFPGEFPFTRGAYTSMYRARPWTIRQYAGFGTAEETNKRFHFLIEKGQKGLSVAFDLPTQMGLDSDDELAKGEVGRVGVAIDSLEDMRILFKGIPLQSISTSMTINATASILLAMYIALAEEKGVKKKSLSGTIQNDILKEYIARGTYIFPPEPSMRVVTDTLAWCSENLPSWNPISISGYHIREAGATAVQELAFTLANGVSYVRAGLDAGLDVDDFVPRFSFFFNVHNNFLEEIAKFRAGRRIWAAIMKDRFKAKKIESMRLRFHTQTAGSTLTAQQAENNIIRVTIQALAAVFGGTQSLHTNSFDEALGLPSDHTSKIALRTQQIIMEESGVTDVIDPLGGSYAIEALTDEIEARTSKLIQKIDEMGGMPKAIEKGFPQKEIERASYEYQKTLEDGSLKVIGLNAYAEKDGLKAQAFTIDSELEKLQVDRLRRIKSSRNNTDVKESLDALINAAEGRENLFPFILDTVNHFATIGEICSALESVFGRYRETRS